MIQAYLDVDVAHAVAEYRGQEIDCAIAVLVTESERQIVWQSPVAVPIVLEDWLDRVMTHLRTVRAGMAAHWPEVEVHVNWWMHEPGDHPDYPHGLSA